MDDLEKEGFINPHNITLESESFFGAGLAVGIVAAIICAVLWAIISVALNIQYSFMAIFVGAAVGIVVAKFGKGSSLPFGIVGAILALFSCVLGDIFTMIGFVAKHQSVGYLQVLERYELDEWVDFHMASLSVYSIMFYGLAMYLGFTMARVNLKKA